MIRNLLLLSCSLFLLTNGYSQKKGKTVAPPPPPQLTADTAKAKKSANPLADKTKSSRKSDGLFTFYQDTATGGLQLFVKKDQLGKEYIYQSFSINGPTSLYLNQSMHRANFVFKIEKAFDN
ncbi:MAG: hypothetical protein ACR2KB_04040 [Chitinophagaceae bacterium]